jgi:hypothetical protein
MAALIRLEQNRASESGFLAEQVCSLGNVPAFDGGAKSV